MLAGTTAAERARRSRCSTLLEAWLTRGASRLDRDRDGKIDDPGAAIMDAAWPKIADAVMSPVLGPLTDRLAELMPLDDDAELARLVLRLAAGTATSTRTSDAAREAGRGPFRDSYCGGGDVATHAGVALGRARCSRRRARGGAGPDPAAWRADATTERIRFAPACSPTTMRWTNRPTFQQVDQLRARTVRR